MKEIKLALMLAALIGGHSDQALSQLFKSQQAALAEAFAKSDTVIRKVVFLTDKQVQTIEREAKAKVESKIVTYYQGLSADSTTGTALFEKNIVRTKPETFMAVVNPDGSVRYVEMLAFHEPAEYLPTSRWFALFKGKFLDERLWPKRGIHGITGATLTVRAITQGVRKSLAIYKVAIATENDH